jgi:hypothetical protein
MLTCEKSESATAADEVQDRNHESDDQQEVDQAASNVEAPSEQPHNEQDRKNSPKH